MRPVGATAAEHCPAYAHACPTPHARTRFNSWEPEEHIIDQAVIRDFEAKQAKKLARQGAKQARAAAKATPAPKRGRPGKSPASGRSPATGGGASVTPGTFDDSSGEEAAVRPPGSTCAEPPITLAPQPERSPQP